MEPVLGVPGGGGWPTPSSVARATWEAEEVEEAAKPGVTVLDDKEDGETRDGDGGGGRDRGMG